MSRRNRERSEASNDAPDQPTETPGAGSEASNDAPAPAPAEPPPPPRRPGLVQLQALSTCAADGMPHFAGEFFSTHESNAERLVAKRLAKRV